MDRRYWLLAAKSLGQNLTSTPGFAKSFLRDIADAGIRFDAKPKAPTFWIYEAFPDAAGLEIDMGLLSFRIFNMDPNEKFLLAALAKARQPKRIFEIGTFDGSTTLLLARHAPQAAVATLDLPPDQASVATVPGEIANAAAAGVGKRYVGNPEETRIEQLYGDSRSFDFSRWYGTVDLVVVDAGHEYDYVRQDTENAYRLVAPGGLIVWDDYSLFWPGVVRAVDESAKRHPGRLLHVLNTECAVYEEPAAADSPTLPGETAP